MIIAFIIWSAVAAIFAGIAIRCRKSDKAVGFFANVAPPAIRDVPAYNKAVSTLWFVAAAFYEAMGIPFLFLQQNSPLFLLIMLAVIVWLILLMIVYLKIEAKYRK
ncbi:MAG: hypothetical protein IKU34_01640 [Clostridia bacterium]|nr:hypothetical protein [Clostridia bacterium]